MSTENNITLVVVCNNHFAVLLAALLKSIDLTHKTKEHIDLYMVDDGLSVLTRAKLAKCITSDQITLIWIKIKDAIPKDIVIPMDNSSFPISAYLRLFASYFVDASVKKVIYLDADMILLEDISILWNIHLQENVVAAVVDRTEKISNPWGGIKNYEALGLDSEARYFNSGLLVIDIPKWKQMNLTERVLTCISENKQYAAFPDQYGLNVVLINNWFELNPLWNCFPMSTAERPCLIHFIGRKPIFKKYDYNQSYKRIFFEYLEQTEWRGFRPQRESTRILRKFYNLMSKKTISLLRLVKLPS